MKQTFFESMGIAGLEKIHTQFIEWLLNNDTIGNNAKFLLLQDLTGKPLKPLSDYDKIYAMTEFESIDLIVRAGNNLVVLENKLTSSQHDNQLKRYEQVVINYPTDNEKNILFRDLNTPFICYILLELIDEKPESDNWSCISYNKWCDIVSKFKDECSTNDINKVIVEEYIKTLKQMTESVCVALNSPCNHEKIFKSKPSKIEKYTYLQNGEYYTTDAEKYIARQNMETIVQKAFFYKLVDKMRIHIGDEVAIEETHGGALIQIKHVILHSNDEEYMLGVQFQGNSVKINYRHSDLKDYKASSKKNIPSSIKKFFKNISTNETVSEGRTKEYYATSWKMKSHYYDMPFEEACKMYQDNYERCIELIDKNINVIKSNHNWHTT